MTYRRGSFYGDDRTFFHQPTLPCPTPLAPVFFLGPTDFDTILHDRFFGSSARSFPLRATGFVSDRPESLWTILFLSPEKKYEPTDRNPFVSHQ